MSARPDDQQPPAWLEDIAHDRLVEETYLHIAAAEAAGADVDAIRAVPRPVG